MSEEGKKTCPLCTAVMDLTDQQLKPCKCGFEICVLCWHHILDLAEKNIIEGCCPACRTPYNKEKITTEAQVPFVPKLEEEEEEEEHDDVDDYVPTPPKDSMVSRMAKVEDGLGQLVKDMVDRMSVIENSLTRILNILDDGKKGEKERI